MDGTREETKKILFYPEPGISGFGFDENGDAVRVWDASSNFVDRVDFDTARTGVTFTFDTNTGNFGVFSQVGVGGAWPAPCSGDIGSPGFSPITPAPLRIVRQPISKTVDAETEAKFQVEASGLPRPTQYQWYFNGAPLPKASSTADFIPLAVNYAGCGLAWKVAPARTDLVIPNAQATQMGDYFVVVANGLEMATSAVVRLTVLTNNAPPRIECPPAELRFPAVGGNAWTNSEVSPFPYGAATFAVLPGGYPTPRIKWSWSADGRNFTDIPGATNNVLEIPYGAQAGIYRAHLTNKWGFTNAYASLTVKPNPRLKITEAMSFSSKLAHPDWWELTNAGDEAVNLYGYRWDDTPGNIGGGPTITNSVIIHPGESVIFVESATPEEFIRWWGASNLPPNLQIISYSANGLSELDGDEINLWRATATADGDFIDSLSFSRGTEGASFWFAPDDPCSEFGVPSIAGECGALTAAESPDVGSPGWTSFTPPQMTSVQRAGAVATLHWKAQPGSTIVVQYTRSLASPPGATNWTSLGTYTFPGAGGSATHVDITNSDAGQCFYRVVMLSPANCPCDMK